MYCRNCGKELPESSNYCPNCGKSQNDLFDMYFKVPKTIQKFYNNHKSFSNFYIVWLILHVTLYITSSKGKYCNDIFYPFNMSFSEVLQGGRNEYEPLLIDVLYYLDEYNFTEFFAYVILIPIIILGLSKFVPYLLIRFKRVYCFLKKRDESGDEMDVEKSEEEKEIEMEKGILPIKERDNIQVPKEITGGKNENIELKENRQATYFIEKVGCMDLIDENPQKANVSEQNIETENVSSLMAKKQTSNREFNLMPIIRRLAGSMIDKIVILILFIVIPIIFCPFSAPGKLGLFAGLLMVSPDNYPYMPSEYENVDISFSVWLIALNIIYFFISERLLHSSFGKWIMGGKLLLWDKDEIEMKWIRYRAYFRGIGMGLAVYGVHFGWGIRNIYVLILYVLIIDVPVFFKKKSLLDMCTDTLYVKR